MSTVAPDTTGNQSAQVAEQRELEVHGMTCASCVSRVERKLKKVPGVVEAQVNLATERATVRFDPKATTVDALIAAVVHAGYTAQVRPVAQTRVADSAESSAVLEDGAGAAEREHKREVE